MKRVLCLLVALMILVSVSPAYALEVQTPYDEEITLFYAHTRAVRADISVSSGTATCTGSATSIQSGNTVSITVTLQRKSGSSWVNVSSWSISEKGYAGLSKTKSLTRNNTYRVTTTAQIKNGSGVVLENASATSNPYTY